MFSVTWMEEEKITGGRERERHTKNARTEEDRSRHAGKKKKEKKTSGERNTELCFEHSHSFFNLSSRDLLEENILSAEYQRQFDLFSHHYWGPLVKTFFN